MNKNLISSISAKLGVESEKLVKALESENETLEFGKKYFLDDDELSTIRANLTKDIEKDKYDEGKTAGADMIIKKAASMFPDVTFEDKRDLGKVIEKILEAKTGKLSDKVRLLEGSQDEKVQSLQKVFNEEKTALQTSIENLKKEREQVEKEFKQKFKSHKIQDLINKEFSGVTFTVPEIYKTSDEKIAYQGREREKAVTMFKNLFEIDFVDEKPVVKKEGKVLKDPLQNPISVTSKITDFVTEWFPNIDTRKGRGKSVTDFSDIDSDVSFEDLCKKKGIKPLTAEADALYHEYKKAKN